MENHHAFFKFFIPEMSANELKIPSAFIQCIKEVLPETVVLRDRYDNLWEMKVEEVGNDWYFKDGWRMFVKENLIKGGEIIVFDYFGRGFFLFKIYGSSGLETKGVGGPRCKNTENNENTTNVKDVGHEKQLNDGGAGSSANPSENKRNFDWFGAQIFKSGLIPQPENPYFVTKFTPNRKHGLYIPIDVISCYKLELPEVITFVDPRGREFQGKRKTWKDGRIHYAKGWRSLCNENLIDREDTCICEFIRRGGDDELCISVSFIRANRQQS